ncbi:hypothetical protein [Frigoribacterium sp. RIT-PI-h]|uniref:hypothetical protein n=1 Tax=Frigoribacterium sp. RIT-PI-h TaxID=1690245 RepID=UPI000B046751|nr:hypothetical protein [Frigoribacterium sp. RIT-PI-h]
MKHRIEPFNGPIPFPAAHALMGSEVVKTFLGFTKAHAVGRAFMWARKVDAKKAEEAS